MITDNNSHKRDELFSPEQWEVLKNSISNRTVAKLCEENPQLLIFPHCINDTHENFRKGKICSIVGDEMTTENIVGFIGVTDRDSGESVELTIRSRFQAEKDKEDYFLHYMLQKVFKVSILDLQHSGSNEDLFDFAIYLFPHYLKRAMRQGLYRQYCQREYNDANVRGAIDVSRHIRTNIPFNGRIAYRTREYQHDNPLMQLIRHTIEYIRNHKYSGNILKCDKDMSDYVRTIYDITPSYKAADLQRVITQNLKPVTHPFYTEYMVLQKLCLHILRCKGIKYGQSSEKIYGILFDCAWLWEEYLATIMPDDKFTHAVRELKNGYKFYDGESDHQRYPDFYSEVHRIVADAKYKHIDKGGIQRNDLFQLIAYLHTLCDNGAKYGALIYPLDQTDGKVWEKPKKLGGYGGYIDTIGIPIPKNTNNYQEFFTQMERNRLVLSWYPSDTTEQIKILTTKTTAI